MVLCYDALFKMKSMERLWPDEVKSMKKIMLTIFGNAGIILIDFHTGT